MFFLLQERRCTDVAPRLFREKAADGCWLTRRRRSGRSGSWHASVPARETINRRSLPRQDICAQEVSRKRRGIGDRRTRGDLCGSTAARSLEQICKHVSRNPFPLISALNGYECMHRDMNCGEGGIAVRSVSASIRQIKVMAEVFGRRVRLSIQFPFCRHLMAHYILLQ